jgi:hypothetical protein
MSAARRLSEQLSDSCVTTVYMVGCRVPSDSPDDWRALEDLRSEAKAKYYGLDFATMIDPYKVCSVVPPLWCSLLHDLFKSSCCR